MSADFSKQVDLTPSTNPSPGLHIHVPNGASASQSNNPTDFPAPPKSGVSVAAKISGTDKQTVRFQNPS